MLNLQYEASSHLPEVIADKELLKQVFLNVCKNGIEAMSDGGVLTISEKVDTVERNVCIDIHDTGSGIPMFVIDKIFDPFFTTKDTGTGLGLSVCQRIIHDMGGRYVYLPKALERHLRYRFLILDPLFHP